MCGPNGNATYRKLRAEAMKVSREADTGSNPMAHQKAYGSLQQVWAFAVRENYRQEVPILQDLMSHHHEKGVTRP